MRSKEDIASKMRALGIKGKKSSSPAPKPASTPTSPEPAPRGKAKAAPKNAKVTSQRAAALDYSDSKGDKAAEAPAAGVTELVDMQKLAAIREKGAEDVYEVEGLETRDDDEEEEEEYEEEEDDEEEEDVRKSTTRAPTAAAAKPAASTGGRIWSFFQGISGQKARHFSLFCCCLLTDVR